MNVTPGKIRGRDRNTASLAFAVMIAGLSACGGSKVVTFPAVELSQVEIFLPGQKPTGDYRAMKTIEIQVRPDQATNEDLLKQAVEQAAAVGADAIVVHQLGANAQGMAVSDLGVDGVSRVTRIITATAVYYPARHPELEEGGS